MTKRILVSSPVRANEDWRTEAFKFCLESIDKQNLPPDTTIDKFFMIHNSEHLKPLLEEHKCSFCSVTSDGEYVTDDRTHHWSDNNISAVAQMRSYIMKYAKENNYDYLFMVDSDLVLHPDTLKTLIEANKDVVAEIIWARWTPDDIEAPNAWDFDSYSFDPDIHTRIAQFRQPGLYKVGMTGACTLFSKPVLQAGVNYDPIPNLRMWGEDRSFSVRAACHNFEIWLDTHYECLHLYRKSDVEKYKNK
jgi:hypothetical protein